MTFLRVGLSLVGLCVCLVAAPVLSPSSAEAQSSGGSFGGGSFGGGGGGGGSYGGGGGGSWGGGSSSWGGGGSTRWSSGSSDWGGSSGTTYHSSGSGGGVGGVLCFILFIVLFVVIVASAKRQTVPVRRQTRWGEIDISALVLAFDARGRAHLQKELDQLAREGNTSTQVGLANLLRRVAMSFRRHESSWLYAAVVNAQPLSPQAAEASFRRIAGDARTRFRHELIRNADGSQKSLAAPRFQARAEEGEGLVVVTLVVAAKRELIDVMDARDVTQVKRLLAEFIALDGHTLAAMEVIWSPADEDDRMSSAELATLYPELRQINQTMTLGRIFCNYCGGAFAAEVRECPHCGAPAEVPVNPPPKLR